MSNHQVTADSSLFTTAKASGRFVIEAVVVGVDGTWQTVSMVQDTSGHQLFVSPTVRNFTQGQFSVSLIATDTPGLSIPFQYRFTLYYDKSAKPDGVWITPLTADLDLSQVNQQTLTFVAASAGDLQSLSSQVDTIVQNGVVWYADPDNPGLYVMGSAVDPKALPQNYQQDATVSGPVTLTVPTNGLLWEPTLVGDTVATLVADLGGLVSIHPHLAGHTLTLDNGLVVTGNVTLVNWSDGWQALASVGPQGQTGPAGTPLDASATTKGVVQLTGDLGGTATNPTVPALSSKASQADLNSEIGRATTAENTNANTISGHIGRTDNPHQTTKAQVGLGNVDNTSDVNKPVSTATQTAINNLAAATDANVAAEVNDTTSQTRTAIDGAFLPLWKPNTSYTAGQVVVNPSRMMVTANANFTSGASYSAANWSPALDSQYLAFRNPAGIPGFTTPSKMVAKTLGWIVATDPTYGVVGDNVTDDSVAWRAVCAAAYASGQTIYIPAGCRMLVSYWVAQGNHSISGAGRDQCSITKHPTVSTASQFIQSDGTTKNVSITGVTFDGNALGTTMSIVKSNAGRFDIDLCRFQNAIGTMLSIEPANGPCSIRRTIFDGFGKIAGQAISVGAGSHRIDIDSCTFRYLKIGVNVGSGTLLKVKDLRVFNCSFDGAWWCGLANKSGSGAGVTYTQTTLTDNAATFTDGKVAVGDIIRTLTPLRTGTTTGNDYANVIIDSAADFVATGVQRGDFVRIANAQALVSAVVSSTELHLDEWLENTAKQPVQAPAVGTSYTVYGVSRAAILTINSATQLTTYGAGFRTYNSAAVTPSAGTLYEIQTVPGYQLVVNTNSAERTEFRGNRVYRSGSDSIVSQAAEIIACDNQVLDGRDNGMVLGSIASPYGSRVIATGNRIYHVGTNGIQAGGQAADSLCAFNTVYDAVSFSTGNDSPSSDAAIFVDFSTGGKVIGNTASAGPGTRVGANAYRIYSNSNGLYLEGNTGSGHTTGIKIDAGAQNVRLAAFQDSMVENISDSGTGTKIAPQAAVAPTPPKVDILTGSGTWTKPAGAVRHRVVCIGAGGGGGSGRMGAAGTVRTGGGAGSGGQIVSTEFQAADLGTTEQYACGAGGVGGAAVTTNDTNGNNGGTGVSTVFSTPQSTAKVFAFGGLGGFGGSTASAAGGSYVVPGSSQGSSSSAAGGTGNSATSGLGRPTQICGAGGGAGGGISSANVDAGGGLGAANLSGNTANPTGGVASSSATAPAGVDSLSPILSGGSGSGGGGSSVSAGGNGGAGAVGSGGGGGGAALNGFSSGAGGNGGAGRIVVITYFS